MNALFYKTDDAAVLKALAVRAAEIKAIRNQGREFASHFGGQLLVQNDTHGYRVAGVKFTPPKDRRYWTVPNENDCGGQRPRSSVAKANAVEKLEQKVLKEDFDARFPRAVALMEPVLNAIGTNEGMLFFAKFSMFEHDGFLWVKTNVDLAPCMVEILGSEFEAAKTAHDASKK